MSLEAWGDENPDDADWDFWADRAMEAGWFNPEDFSPGAIAILRERERQEVQEGWTPDRDDEYTAADLVWAAISYATEAGSSVIAPNGVGDCPVAGWAPEMWPWDGQHWKPSADPIRNLEKAGALLAAEIDRLKRKGAA